MQKDKLFIIAAKSISYAFHPLLMASFAVVLVFNSGHYLSVVNADVRNTIYSIYFILTFVLPALLIPVMYYFGLISKIEIDERKERLLPMISIIIMYLLGYYFMNRISMPPILINIIISSAILAGTSFIVTIFWKISLHTAGMGGLLGFVIFLGNTKGLHVLLPGLIIIVFAGLVGTARLYLNKHNQAQVYAGYALGFISIFLSLLIL